MGISQQSKGNQIFCQLDEFIPDVVNTCWLSSCTSCIGRGWPKRASLVSYPTMPWLGITCVVPDTSPPQADGVSCWLTGLAIVSTRVTGGVGAIACVVMQGVTTQLPCHASAPHHPLAGGCGRWLTGLVNVLTAFAWLPGLDDAPAESAVQRQRRTSSWLLGLPLSPARPPLVTIPAHGHPPRNALAPRGPRAGGRGRWLGRLRPFHRVRAGGRPTGEGQTCSTAWHKGKPTSAPTREAQRGN